MKRVLITRQPEQSVEFINLLSKNGFAPFLLPMIKTVHNEFTTKKNFYDYIVFPSVNSVKYFFLKNNNIDYKYIVAVGPKTKEFLTALGIKTDYMPKVFSAKGLINLFNNMEIKNSSFLLPGPKKRNNEFVDFLRMSNCDIEMITVYETTKVVYDKNYVNEFIKNNKIEVVTFASPSAAEFFIEQINKPIENLTFVSIGKTTYDYLKEIGIDSIYPESFTIKSMVELLKEKFYK
jgi:uroporphyrinogen-III synthase